MSTKDMLAISEICSPKAWIYHPDYVEWHAYKNNLTPKGLLRRGYTHLCVADSRPKFAPSVLTTRQTKETT